MLVRSSKAGTTWIGGAKLAYACVAATRHPLVHVSAFLPTKQHADRVFNDRECLNAVSTLHAHEQVHDVLGGELVLRDILLGELPSVLPDG